MAEVMTVNQFAKWAGVAPHVIRYYARIGLLKPRRSASGYKLFAAAPAVMVNRSAPKVREIIRQRIDENRRALGELRALQRRMESAAAQWEDMI